MNAPKPQQTAGSVCMRVSNLTIVLAEAWSASPAAASP